MSESLREATQITGVSLESIQAASSRIKPHIHETPILTSRLLNEYLNSSHNSSTKFFFKAENFQKTGSFKVRGVSNAIATLETPPGTPVVTHSAGNHAAAVSAAASSQSRPAHVVIPCTAPEVKAAAVRCYGGIVTRCGPTSEDRVKTAEEIRAQVGGTIIHPFLNPYVISGQGTIGLEIIRQVPNVEAIIVSVSGGGLIAGITIAVKSLRPEVVVIGAEPRLANAAARSMEAGKRVFDDGSGKTIADGLRSGIGEVGWEVVKRLVERIVVVEEEEIVEAMKMVWTRMKVIIEGAAAVSVAAGKVVAGMGFKNVVVILCGGNVDLDNLPWVKK